MTEEKWAAVDSYITNLLIHQDDALDAAIREGNAAGLPAINVTPGQGKMLQILALMQGAHDILEIGTLAGYSTIWLGRALPADGHLITLELDPKHARIARANIARAGLEDVVEVRQGRALDTLTQLVGEGRKPFDLIFIDADKGRLPAYFAWALRLSHPGTLIVVDNVVRDGEVIDASSTDPDVQGVRNFNAAVAAEARVSATEIQTVGSKGYDGFALVFVLTG
ncbi:MAG: O-methyltransferase [Thaumarchaeota archaeon]|nr:O-methyltransferase [Nitrososphaerota archaeon]